MRIVSKKPLKEFWQKYGRLLAKVTPLVPKTEQDNERLLGEIRKLMDIPDEQMPLEQGALLDLLGTLVERFEDEFYGFQDMKMSPAERLRHLMQESDVRPTDLISIFGHLPTVSAVLAGKRPITKRQAVKLGERFKLNPAAFLAWD